MTGHMDTGNPDAEHGFRKEIEEEGNKTRAPSHGRKLKNASSAKRAAGAKFRQDKADLSMSAEEGKRWQRRNAPMRRRQGRNFLIQGQHMMLWTVPMKMKMPGRRL